MPKRSFGLSTKHNDPRDSWAIEKYFQTTAGITIVEGQEAEILGERGRYVFRQHVLSETSEWLDFVGTGTYGAFRSFRTDRIKKVYAKTIDTPNSEE